MDSNTVKQLEAVGYRMVLTDFSKHPLFTKKGDTRNAAWKEANVVIDGVPTKFFYPHYYKKDLETTIEVTNAKENHTQPSDEMRSVGFSTRTPQGVELVGRAEIPVQLGRTDNPPCDGCGSLNAQLAGLQPLNYLAATWAIAHVNSRCVAFEKADTTLETLRNAVNAFKDKGGKLSALAGGFEKKCQRSGG
jgi:hypothetical protein